MHIRHLLNLWVAAVLLSGCAALSGPPPLSEAAPAGPAAYGGAGYDPAGAPLWAALMGGGEPADGRSAFTFLETGPEAYRARLALIEAAHATIDIQTYIWEFDESGRAITAALLRAADRGVQVRALIDGFRVDEDTAPLKEFATHPNVEVRLFNAFRTSFRSDIVRYGELASDFIRLNQRMHDKVILVDNGAAILGGRNVSDEYFGLNPERYFYDRDVLVAGPLTDGISAAFHRFWHAPYAVPVSRFGAPDALSADEGEPAAGPSTPDLPQRLEGAALTAELALLRGALVRAEARLVRSAPGPVFAGQAPRPEAELEAVFLEALAEAEQEVVIQTPYLTLTPGRNAALRAARERGVTVRLHTNSLASTDWAVVQHGYVQERRKLLHWGVELFELKDRPESCCVPGDGCGDVRKVVLHPKTIVFDRRLVLIGSFNVDRRSVLHNSEIGVLIDSPMLATRVLGRIDHAMAPENSWRLVAGEAGRPVWLDESCDPPRRYTDDPHTGFAEQLMPWLGYFLPIDGLL